MSGSASGPAAIEARDVFRIYATPEGSAAALQGLTLTVRAGEILVVLGPSGSGKTTLLRILAGLERPSAGVVRVLGTDLTTLSDARLARYRAETLGIVEQHYFRSLSPSLRAVDLVSLQLDLAGAPRRETRARAVELLARVGLADRARSRPRELAGGEQQRVAVCAALAHRPRVLLADEPTGELDANAAALYDLIGEIARDEGVTSVIVTHDEQAGRIADRVVHIRDGRLSGEARAASRHVEETIVVGRGGWLRIPEELLARAGIGERARIRLEEERTLALSAADGALVAPSAERVRATPGAGAGRSDDEPAVVVEDLHKTYESAAAPTVVFDGLTATFAAGGFHAVTGRSGSGKTALLHLLAGLERPSAGRVLVLGHDLARASRADLADFRRRHVALIGQGPNLVSFLSALENVEVGLALRGIPREQSRARAEQWLTEVGLAERLHWRVARLSAGEQQRVAIARALASGAELILADEPTARLDQANAGATALLLAAAARVSGRTVVCASHDPLVTSQADTRLDLDRGAKGSAVASLSLHR
jgi:ABC-type lipoprotein export system ATPase subunit